MGLYNGRPTRQGRPARGCPELDCALAQARPDPTSLKPVRPAGESAKSPSLRHSYHHFPAAGCGSGLAAVGFGHFGARV